MERAFKGHFHVVFFFCFTLCNQLTPVCVDTLPNLHKWLEENEKKYAKHFVEKSHSINKTNNNTNKNNNEKRIRKIPSKKKGILMKITREREKKRHSTISSMHILEREQLRLFQIKSSTRFSCSKKM